jgi:hypothetical protein
MKSERVDAEHCIYSYNRTLKAANIENNYALLEHEFRKIFGLGEVLGIGSLPL